MLFLDAMSIIGLLRDAQLADIAREQQKEIKMGGSNQNSGFGGSAGTHTVPKVRVVQCDGLYQVEVCFSYNEPSPRWTRSQLLGPFLDKDSAITEAVKLAKSYDNPDASTTVVWESK